MNFLKIIWYLYKFIVDVFLLWLVLYSFWHGIKIETGNFSFELYGIARFFGK